MALQPSGLQARPVPSGRGDRQPAPVRDGEDRGVRGGGPDVPYDAVAGFTVVCTGVSLQKVPDRHQPDVYAIGDDDYGAVAVQSLQYDIITGHSYGLFLILRTPRIPIRGDSAGNRFQLFRRQLPA